MRRPGGQAAKLAQVGRAQRLIDGRIVRDGGKRQGVAGWKGAHVRPVVIVFWQNLVFLAVAVVLALVTPLIPSEGVTHPSLAFLLRPWKIGPFFDMALITSLGLLSALAMILFTEAYRLGEANFVAPFEYSAMLWAVIFGFLVWGDLPGPATAIGGALVAGAGLFMLLAARRERLARLAGGPVEV